MQCTTRKIALIIIHLLDSNNNGVMVDVYIVDAAVIGGATVSLTSRTRVAATMLNFF